MMFTTYIYRLADK